MLRIVSNWRGMKCRQVVGAVHALADGPVVDLFGGTGGVALNGNGCLWNELDQRLHRVARAVRDDVAEFAERCAAMPRGCQPKDPRSDGPWQEGNDLAATFANPPEPHEFAWLCCFSFAGRNLGRVFEERAGSWSGYRRSLGALSERLGGLELGSADALDCLRGLPSGTTVYADPPYGMASDYVGAVDLEALVEALNRHDGTVVLSGYGEPPEGWRSLDAVPVRRKAIEVQGYQSREARSREFLAWRKG